MTRSLPSAASTTTTERTRLRAFSDTGLVVVVAGNNESMTRVAAFTFVLTLDAQSQTV